MIKTIIKRDGSKEDFIPNKVNGWGIWAAEKLGRHVDWASIVINAVSVLPSVVTSQQLQEALIGKCLEQYSWEYNLMAGRLYSSLLIRIVHGSDTYPTIKEVQDRLVKDGLMRKLNYSDEEYAKLEKVINHDYNLKYPHYAIHQNRNKYALKNRVKGTEYETSQFMYMRMAMALAEKEPVEKRLSEVKAYYEEFANHRINVPTPYYVNLGTVLDGYASCCIYTTKDTAPSLAAGDHIAYMMTVMSAGIGYHLRSRSIGDAVRGGLIQHQGKLPYIRAYASALSANTQNGRGGAGTCYFNAFDPEIETLIKLKNPITPVAKQIRGSDYSFGSNRLVVQKAARNEEMALFSYGDAPELYEAIYSGDNDYFERLYEKFIASKLPRTMVSARKIVVAALTEAIETGRTYEHFTDWMNIHTPFLNTIWSSNLCSEINLPTGGFNTVKELYQSYNEKLNFIRFKDGRKEHQIYSFDKVMTKRAGKISALKLQEDDVIINVDGSETSVTKVVERSVAPEIALCNIGGIIVSNIKNDDEYYNACYRVLKMIRFGILNSSYVFENLRQTAKARMNAGVGIVGLAHLMAKKGHSYSSQEGRNFIHELAETHYWHLANASLELSKEYGVAEWMYKTKWVDGWTPLDTYCKEVDSLVTVECKRDWKGLSAKIVANGGILNSVLVAHMPSESSSISGATTNGVYPIRNLYLNKTNETQSVSYVVPDSTRLKDRYDSAWDTPTDDMNMCYAILQKFCDQGISADRWLKLQGDAKIGVSVLMPQFINRHKFGNKQGYYQNIMGNKDIDLNASETTVDVGTMDDSGGCGSGGCSI